MKRPARVKIVGKAYGVTYAPQAHPELNDPEDGELHGRIRHESQQVYVLETLSLEQEQDTLLHEVFHGIEAAMGLDLEEDEILRLATGLLAVIKDNPTFVRYLAAKVPQKGQT